MLPPNGSERVNYANGYRPVYQPLVDTTNYDGAAREIVKREASDSADVSTCTAYFQLANSISSLLHLPRSILNQTLRKEELLPSALSLPSASTSGRANARTKASFTTLARMTVRTAIWTETTTMLRIPKVLMVAIKVMR